MITLHVNVLKNEHEVVVFGNAIVVDIHHYSMDDLESYLFVRYPHLDVAKINETVELNKTKFPNESNDLITKFGKFSLTQLIAIASGTKNKETMLKLAQYKELLPRCTLARRADLDEDLQLILARDKEQNVLGSLALNKALTMDAFELLIKNADSTTKEMLALRLSNNDKMLEILAKDKDVEVRRTVYQHQGLNQYLKEYLEEEFGDKATA